MLKLNWKENRWIFLAVIFVLLNTLLIYKEQFWGSLIPFALALLLLAILKIDTLLLVVVALVPLSVPLSDIAPNLQIDMNLPTEPLLALILFIFIFKLIREHRFDKRIALHPVSIVIYAYLFWMFVTSVSSTMPIVSFKFLLSRIWFIVAFYFLTTQLFKNPKNIQKYVVVYTISLTIVVFYAMFRLIKFGIFEEKISHWAANPFYKDHTSYGAVIAFYIPPLLALISTKGFSNSKRLGYTSLLVVLTIGIIFSYSRAAWLSVLAVFGFWVLIKLKIKAWVVFAGIAFLASFLLLFGSSIMRNLKKNDQDSSTTSISDHIQSMSNISTDASNVERLNRWNCALRMFKQKPLFGWGPGTYMFQYAPFQRSSEKTIISTNQGTGGNAHSEYLGPLSEQGFMGTFFYLLLIFVTIKTSRRVIYKSKDPFFRKMGIGCILGLTTYYLHGGLNNFLDSDKASVPFWGFLAILVAIDTYHKTQEQKNKEVSAVDDKHL